MSPVAKKEYFKTIAPRYQKASRKAKSQILNEFCLICGYHRKYATAKLSGFKVRRRPPLPKRKPGRPSAYSHPEVLKPLQAIWKTANLPCSKRLKAILPVWIPPYQVQFGSLSAGAMERLRKISPATIDRVLEPVRLHRSRGLATTKPGLILKHQIPIQGCQWNESRPGFLEADTVAHCGNSMAGEFVYTLDTVDIATGWTEQRALWGKGESGVLREIRDIERSLPFPLLGFDCDNGPEFLNWHLVKLFQHRKYPVRFTRSRPYRKNDNAHVEQKNWTHVRQWLGYLRFDNPAIVEPLNDLYAWEWRLFCNFFLPSMKLKAKKRVGSKIVKVHDDPKTPFERVLASRAVPTKTKQLLKEQFLNLNPFKLHKTILQKISEIRALAR